MLTKKDGKHRGRPSTPKHRKPDTPEDYLDGVLTLGDRLGAKMMGSSRLSRNGGGGGVGAGVIGRDWAWLGMVGWAGIGSGFPRAQLVQEKAPEGHETRLKNSQTRLTDWRTDRQTEEHERAWMACKVY